MLTDENPYQERFHELLDEIREEVNGLRNRVQDLQQENEQLRNKIEEAEHNPPDVFSEMDETERMALHHQVLGLISKIDEHLEEEA